MPALRMPNGRFVPKEVATELRAMAEKVGVSEESLQSTIKDCGLDATRADMQEQITLRARRLSEAEKAEFREALRLEGAAFEGLPGMQRHQNSPPRNRATEVVGQPIDPEPLPTLKLRTRGKAYRRVVRSVFVENGDGMGQIRYLHATKGWRTRKLTPELYSAMSL